MNNGYFLGLPPCSVKYSSSFFRNLPETRQSELVIKLTVNDMTSVIIIDFSQIFSPVIMWVLYRMNVYFWYNSRRNNQSNRIMVDHVQVQCTCFDGFYTLFFIIIKLYISLYMYNRDFLKYPSLYITYTYYKCCKINNEKQTVSLSVITELFYRST